MVNNERVMETLESKEKIKWCMQDVLKKIRNGTYVKRMDLNMLRLLNSNIVEQILSEFEVS